MTMASRTKEHNKNSKIKNKTGKFKSAKEINQEVKNPRWKNQTNWQGEKS